MTVISWDTYGDIHAFVGNSLLKPMSQTEPVGLDPAFWEAFPDLGCDAVRAAALSCAAFARGIGGAANEAVAVGDVEATETAGDAGAAGASPAPSVTDVSCEYTRLFVGPPSPAAPPWETMNRAEGVTVGFGQPTFAMQDILGKLGLEVCNENNQYADHMGLELLTLSELCRRAQREKCSPEDVRAFIVKHPGGWIGVLADKVRAAFPDGYFARLLALEQAVLDHQVTQLESTCSAR